MERKTWVRNWGGTCAQNWGRASCTRFWLQIWVDRSHWYGTLDFLGHQQSAMFLVYWDT